MSHFDLVGWLGFGNPFGKNFHDVDDVDKLYYIWKSVMAFIQILYILNPRNVNIIWNLDNT